MLDELQATRFIRQVNSGRTKPLLIALENEEGDEVEVVAKFSESGGIGVNGLIREALCAALAADLNLPVPRPYLVRIDQPYIDAVRVVAPETADVLAASNRVGFGSRFLGQGYASWMRDRSIPEVMRQSAVEIFSFDQFVANSDRRPENPNLLSKGDDFAIIDHELALYTEGIIGWQAPWHDGALDHSSGPDKHILSAGLKGNPINMDGIVSAWEGISDDRLAQYISTMPTDWPDAEAITGTMCHYLAELRDNIESAVDQVRKVLL